MGTLVLTRETGGLRHYLEGEPVHAGVTLELQLRDGTWLPGRYEASRHGDELWAWFFTGITRESLRLNQASILRWPA